MSETVRVGASGQAEDVCVMAELMALAEWMKSKWVFFAFTV